MKSTWFGCRKRYEFAKTIQESHYALHGWDLFQSFLTCAHASLVQQLNRMVGTFDDDLESDYIKARENLKHPDKMQEAFAILVMALDDDPYDFLGLVLMEWDLSNKKGNGQVFTPRSLSQLMAQSILGDLEPQEDKCLTLDEPACGGGSMAIEASTVLQNNGFYPWHYHWQCTDVDWKCYAMTYIQLFLIGVPAIVRHGNTISQECWQSTRTFASAMHGRRFMDIKNGSEQFRYVTVQREPSIESTDQLQQLSLGF